MVFAPKLTPDQKAEILSSTGVSVKDLADKFDIAPQTVYHIRQQAKDEAKRMEREAAEAMESRAREGTIRDPSEWDDNAYIPENVIDRLYVPPEIIPDGIEYQWCTYEVRGMEFATRMSEFERKGWKSVPAERHAGRWTQKGATGSITVEGLMLMERPRTWCDRARNHEQAAAKQQMDKKKGQLSRGDLPGVSLDTQHPSALRTNRIQSTYERITVPEE